jgi:hypothetical protein
MLFDDVATFLAVVVAVVVVLWFTRDRMLIIDGKAMDVALAIMALAPFGLVWLAADVAAAQVKAGKAVDREYLGVPSFAFRAVPPTLHGYKGSVLYLGAADGVTVL